MRRQLRRETAFELPITPSKSPLLRSPSFGGDRSSLSMGKQQSADPFTRQKPSANYLVPSMSEPQPRPFRTSSERLRKNSSTDTEYSQLPYHVIKQSSNDTNTSLTGSFNVDTGATSYDLPLDSATVDNVDETPALRRSPLPPHRIHPSREGDAEPTHAFQKISATVSTSTTTVLPKPVNVAIPMPPFNAMRRLMQESSSTSTDESKDEQRAAMPSISTLVVQDEIAKLSSNIMGGSSGNEADDDDATAATATGSVAPTEGAASNKDATSYNETMC